jgi:broad specificity phosphatase PhoE
MLTLVLLRHGQTACSVRGSYCGGGCDVTLNDNGRRMADAVNQSLAAQDWAAIVSSPQRRALQTVEPLARTLGIEVEVREGLRELHYGTWDGRTPSQLQSTAEYREWLADPATYAPPGGETATAVAARASRAIEAVRRKSLEGRVLVAAHKTTIRVLLCTLLGIDPALYRARLAQPLGGLTVVSFHDTGPRLDALGDLSHLPSELRGIAGS